MKIVTIAALGLSLIVGCTSDPTTPEKTVRQERTESVVATVMAVDQNTREVQLKADDGSEVSFKASEAVKNLPQVKVGDKVKVNYYRSVVARMKKPGDTAEGPTVMAETAPAGEKPGAFARESRTVTAKILSLDRATSNVTIKTSEGKTVTVKADPKNLEGVKVGDELTITYVEGFAVSVEDAD